jgi:hypothetical protein
MKISRRTEMIVSFLTLFALDFYLGTIAPWWVLVIPAFMAGWLVRACVLRVAPLAALCAWLVKALSHDVPTGFRLSNRIAGVMGINASIVAYLVMGALVAFAVFFSVLSGKSLRAALFARALPKS